MSLEQRNNLSIERPKLQGFIVWSTQKPEILDKRDLSNNICVRIFNGPDFLPRAEFPKIKILILRTSDNEI